MVEEDGVRVIARNRVEEALVDELRDGAASVGELGRDSLEERDAHPPPDHRGDLENRSSRAWQRVDPGGEHALDRGGYGIVVPAALHTPPAGFGDEDAGLAQRTHELADEERVSTRASACYASERERCPSAERLFDELGHGGVVEWSELDRSRLRKQLAERTRSLGPREHVENEGNVTAERRELLRECERRGICPVDVVDREDRRPLPRERADPGNERLVEPSPERLGLERLEFAVSVEPQQAGEIRHDLPELGERIGHRAIRGGGIGVGADPGKRPEQVGVRPVREPGTVRQAAGVEPAHFFRVGQAADLLEQPGLTDAGLTRQCDDGAEAFAQAFERLPCHRELPFTAHEHGGALGPCALRRPTRRQAGTASLLPLSVSSPTGSNSKSRSVSSRVSALT